MIGLCVICANDRPGEKRLLDGRRVFVCDRCENEHTRDGGYSFDEDTASSGRTPHPKTAGTVFR